MSASRLSFVVLASGEGTNAQAILNYALKNPNRFQPLALISDRGGIPALQKAQDLGIPTFVLDGKAQLEKCRELAPRWAFLAGYKRLVSSEFLDFFYDSDWKLNRVLNIHPSLLPAYPGLKGYEKAFADGLRLSGITIHFVDSGMDTGMPLLQESFRRLESDTLNDFIRRGQELEHRLYTEAMELVAENKISISPGRRWVSISGR